MDEAARKVLSKNKSYIKQNLHLDGSILDYLEADQTLTTDNVDSILAEKTNEDKISKLIMILQRKGPAAFDAFLSALDNTNTQHLADKLRDKYQEEKETNNDPIEKSNKQTQTVTGDDVVPKITTETDDINSSTIQYTDSRRSSLQCSHTQAGLTKIHHKLKMHLFHVNQRELSFGSPTPVTIEMVEDLVDMLLKIEHDCYTVLGVVNQNSLLTHVIDLKEARKQLQTMVTKKEEQTKRYADKIFKLDHRCKELERKLKVQEDQFRKSNDEKQNLQETVKQIKADMVGDFQELETNMKCVQAENDQLKLKLSKCEVEIKHLKEKNDLYINNKGMSENEAPMEQATQVHTLQGENQKQGAIKISDKCKEAVTNRKPSTLQECKDICTANNPHFTSQLRAKVLFAENVNRNKQLISRPTGTKHSVNNANGPTTIDRKHDSNILADFENTYNESTSNTTDLKKKISEKYSIESLVNQRKSKSPSKKQPIRGRPTWRRKLLK